MTRRRFLAPLAVMVVLVAACGGPTPSKSPSPATSATPPVPTEEPQAARCPDLEFDPLASLDPVFDADVFSGDESQVFAAGWVKGLEGLYTGAPDADPCAIFTETGLEDAMAVDDRLGQAIAGVSRLDADLVYRYRGEGTYDLRQRPPTVPLDVVFDIPAGSTTTDGASGATDTSLAAQRVAFRVTFAFDGERWLADAVEAVPPADAAWWALPTPRVDDPPCRGFRDDPDRTPFDDDAGSTIDRERQRPWCADGGNGPGLDDDLVQLGTRVPCGETRIAVLTLGLPLGTPSDVLDGHQYLRDPGGGALQRGWLHERWKGDVEPPEDASDTGWTNGNMDVWIDPSEVEAAIYVRTGGRFERWPRGDDPSVTDCN